MAMSSLGSVINLMVALPTRRVNAYILGASGLGILSIATRVRQYAAPAEFIKSGVNGVTVRSQEEFYEQLWLAQAGDVIQISVRRADSVRVIPVPSIDRYRLYRPSRN